MPGQRVRLVVNRGLGVEAFQEMITVRTSDGAHLLLEHKFPAGKARAALLLLHGFSQNRFAFDVPSRSLANHLVLRGFSVYSLDMRGTRSSRGPLASSFKDYVDYDLPATLSCLRQREGRAPFLIGHSLGGAIAYGLAPRYEKELAGIITISGLFGFAHGNRVLHGLLSGLSRLPAQDVLSSLHRLAFPSVIAGRALYGSSLVAQGRLGHLVPIMPWVPGSIEKKICNEILQHAFDQMSLGVTRDLLRWGAEGRFDSVCETIDYAEEFARTKLPLLVIAGDRDSMVSAADTYGAFERSQSGDKEYRLFSHATDGCAFGHYDLIFGRKAVELVWPSLDNWLLARS